MRVCPEVLSSTCRVTPGRVYLTCTHDETHACPTLPGVRHPQPDLTPWRRRPPFCLLFPFLAGATVCQWTHGEGMYFTLLDVHVCESEIRLILKGCRQEEMLWITSGVALRDSVRPTNDLSVTLTSFNFTDSLLSGWKDSVAEATTSYKRTKKRQNFKFSFSNLVQQKCRQNISGS